MAALPEERVVLAGEYVLGTLDAAGKAEAERLVATSEPFRQAVWFWERRFALLGLRMKPIEPRLMVWFGLKHRLAQVQPAKPRARAPAAQTWAWVATAASLVLAVALVTQMRRPLPAPQIVTERVEVRVPAASYVAMLQLKDSTLQWAISAVPDQRRLKVRAIGEAPKALAGRDAELWLITDAGPVSLGVLPQAGESERTLPPTMTLANGKVLAISVEPPGGSPTGKPTGPVISTAAVMQAG